MSSAHRPAALLRTVATYSLLAFGAGGAQAVTSSSASLTEFTIQLISHDGSTPFIEFADGDYRSYAQAYTYTYGAPGDFIGVSDVDHAGPFGSLSVSGSSPASSAQAQTGGSGNYENASASVTGSAQYGGPYAASPYTHYQAYAYPFSGEFTLSPHTSVLFTAVAQASATSTINLTNGSDYEYSVASARLEGSLYTTNVDGSNYQSFSADANAR